MHPGIYQMPAAEYHALPHLSNSLAQLIIEQSPKHAWTACRALNPNYVEEEKETFDIGSACHALLLEGQDRMVVIEADDWRKKEAREARDAARAAGKHPVLAKRWQDVMKMRDVAVQALAECQELGGISLADGVAEQVIIFDVRGVRCRVRLDWWQRGRAIIDYKTCENAAPEAFSRQLIRMGYHIQDEFYSLAVEKTTGARDPFYIMAQEKSPPYAVSFHACAPSLRTVAEQDLSYAIPKWQECLTSNRWPAHSPRIHYTEAPSWTQEAALNRADEHGIPYDVSKLWHKEVA